MGERRLASDVPTMASTPDQPGLDGARGMADPPDPSLAERWYAGDLAARDALFARYYINVRRFFDVRVLPVSEDLTQQTFLVCTEAIGNLKKAASFRSFLFGVARNVLLRYLRRADRTATHLAEQAQQRDPTQPSLSGIVAMQAEHRLVLQGLDRLPADLRTTLEMYYWEELSGPEIADVLGVPFSTVTTRLGRARERLRKEIARLTRPGRLRDVVSRELSQWTRGLVHTDAGPGAPHHEGR